MIVEHISIKCSPKASNIISQINSNYFRYFCFDNRNEKKYIHIRVHHRRKKSFQNS